jgi:glycerophosphoryl diester phosphodiesterase
VLVVHHDPEISGVALSDQRYSELPSSVAQLSEALDACGELAVNVEIKNSMDEPGYDEGTTLVEAVLADINAAGLAAVIVSSFDLRTIDLLHAARPDIATGYLVLDPRDPRMTMELTAERGHRAIHPWDRCVDAEVVAAAHQLGLQVNVWTVDDPDRQRELAGWGVDTIITNTPAKALAALNRRGLPRT